MPIALPKPCEFSLYDIHCVLNKPQLEEFPQYKKASISARYARQHKDPEAISPGAQELRKQLLQGEVSLTDVELILKHFFGPGQTLDYFKETSRNNLIYQLGDVFFWPITQELIDEYQTPEETTIIQSPFLRTTEYYSTYDECVIHGNPFDNAVPVPMPEDIPGYLTPPFRDDQLSNAFFPSMVSDGPFKPHSSLREQERGGSNLSQGSSDSLKLEAQYTNQFNTLQFLEFEGYDLDNDSSQLAALLSPPKTPTLKP